MNNEILTIINKKSNDTIKAIELVSTHYLDDINIFQLKNTNNKIIHFKKDSSIFYRELSSLVFKTTEEMESFILNTKDITYKIIDNE